MKVLKQLWFWWLVVAVIIVVKMMIFVPQDNKYDIWGTVIPIIVLGTLFATLLPLPRANRVSIMSVTFFIAAWLTTVYTSPGGMTVVAHGKNGEVRVLSGHVFLYPIWTPADQPVSYPQEYCKSAQGARDVISVCVGSNLDTIKAAGWPPLPSKELTTLADTVASAMARDLAQNPSANPENLFAELSGPQLKLLRVTLTQVPSVLYQAP